MTFKLKSIKKEAADCRAACVNLKIGDWAWHVHHEILAEPLTEPIENRITYILENKTDNVALRLRLLRPLIPDEIMLKDSKVKKASAEYAKAYAEWDKARAEWRKIYYAKWDKASAAKLNKARSKWNKAYAEYRKARAEYSKAATPHYKRLFPDSSWNGKTIFAGDYALTS